MYLNHGCEFSNYNPKIQAKALNLFHKQGAGHMFEFLRMLMALASVNVFVVHTGLQHIYIHDILCCLLPVSLCGLHAELDRQTSFTTASIRTGACT